MNKELILRNIASNIDIKSDIDLRSIYDDAMEFQNNKSPSLPESVIYRGMVNNIRHKHSNYDKQLRRIHRLNDEVLYRRYKNMVLDKICDKYPMLEDECEKQKYDINICNIVRK